MITIDAINRKMYNFSSEEINPRDNSFSINGYEKRYKLLLVRYWDKTDSVYIAFTDMIKRENGKEKIYAYYRNTKSELYVFQEVDTKEELKMIENSLKMKKLKSRIKKIITASKHYFSKIFRKDKKNYALIFSHKQLLHDRKYLENLIDTAVICSSYPLNDKEFEWIPKRLILEFQDTNNDNGNAFQPEQARIVSAFLQDIPDGKFVIFCCDGGDSRSPALAAAYMRFRHGDEEEIWTNPRFRPNALVYKRQCEAFGIEVKDSEIESLQNKNSKAFSEYKMRRMNSKQPLK